MSRAALRQTLDRLTTSYWLFPILGGIIAVALAYIMLLVDAQIPDEALSNSPFVLAASPNLLRALMTDLAATLLATAGIVFSLLIVPLSMAASQFGSRLLRVYVRDRTIQIILAIFTSTFVYCFVVAISIPYTVSEGLAPQIAATVGLTLSLMAFASLIVLIQWIASMLQAPNLISAASAELGEVIANIFDPDNYPPDTMNSVATETLAAIGDRDGVPIYATEQGYIQAVDFEVALAVATRHDLIIRLVRSPGHFVHAGELIAFLAPAANVIDRAVTNVADAYRLGNLRSPVQDLEYGVNQIVEVAIRAMSPAINDPFTAMTCLDHLGARLAVLAAQPVPLSVRFDSTGALRLVSDDHSFPEMLSAAFDMLRRVSRENANVLLSMLDAIDRIAQAAYTDEYRTELGRHVALVSEESAASLSVAWDKERVQRRAAELTAGLSRTD